MPEIFSGQDVFLFDSGKEHPYARLNKTIWICWWQGWAVAPEVARKCLNSWIFHNEETWEIRCLDASSAKLYVPDLPDLRDKDLTLTSLSDILRIHLLKEYGGVWVDSTVLCNQPLDTWLPNHFGEGFFVFSQPVPERMVSSWFIAALEGHPVIDAWCSAVRAYWQVHARMHDYFWFHYLFYMLYDCQPGIAASWDRVEKISAIPPHAIQGLGLETAATPEVTAKIDWAVLVFKLTYRYAKNETAALAVVDHVLEHWPYEAHRVNAACSRQAMHAVEKLSQRPWASLKVKTVNLGDHVQILAGLRLLERLGIRPRTFIDRDDEIAESESVAALEDNTRILMNGWFKTNRAQWPPHPKLRPVFVSHHIRLFQCPELLETPSLEYYRKHGQWGAGNCIPAIC